MFITKAHLSRRMTSVPFKLTAGADVFVAVSMDQLAAQELGKHTQLASIELGIESNAMLGTCDNGSSCAYTNTIAWRTPTTPLPIENDPRAVFERLFGTAGSTDAEARRSRMHRDRSIWSRSSPPFRQATARCSTRRCSSTGRASATAIRISTTICRSRSSGKATGITGKRYVRYPKGTPLANLHVTVLSKLGVHVDKFGDATGLLERLSDQTLSGI